MPAARAGDDEAQIGVPVRAAHDPHRVDQCLHVLPRLDRRDGKDERLVAFGVRPFGV